MKNGLIRGAKFLLGLIPLGIYKLFIKKDIVAFFYHAVSDHPMPHVSGIYPPITPTRFEQDLLYLKKHYNLVTYAELHAHILEGKPLPPKAAHLSFDDGYVECFTVARPLLQKHNIPCTFFITTDWIDNQMIFFNNKVSLCIEWMKDLPDDLAGVVLKKIEEKFGLDLKDKSAFYAWVRACPRSEESQIDTILEAMGFDQTTAMKTNPYYMSTAQIKQLAKEGFTLGSHTVTHTKLVDASAEQVEEEIVNSSQVVKEITGADVIPFAFPNSAHGVNRNLLGDIRERHPFLGLLFDTKGIRRDAPFMVNRVWVEREDFNQGGEKTAIPAALKDAYVEEAFERLRSLIRSS